MKWTREACRKCCRPRAWTSMVLAALVAGIAQWALPTEASAQITVLSATWGGQTQPVFNPNACSPSTVQPGNWTPYTAAACTGQFTCTFAPTWQQACPSGQWPCGDPAFGCAKDFSASYICGGSQAVRTAYASFTQPAVTLSCPQPQLITYSWSAGSWSSCAPANQLCGPGTLTRSIACLGSDGNTYPNSNCAGAPPASSQSCGVTCTAALLEQACLAKNPANHGAVVSCVAAEANMLVSQGIISASQVGSFVSPTAQSSAGKK